MLLILNIGNVSGQTIIGGVLSENTRLRFEHSPYLVSDDLIIPDTVTLQIDPGSTLLFEKQKKISSEGVIVAIGTQDSLILFTSSDTKKEEKWKGIYLYKSKVDYTSSHEYISGNIIKNCIVENSIHGINVGHEGSFMLDSSLIHENEIYGIHIKNCDSCILINSEIHNNAVIGVKVTSIDSTRYTKILNCSFYNNTSAAIEIEALKGTFKFSTISNCNIVNNGNGININHFNNSDVESNIFSMNCFVNNSNTAICFTGSDNVCTLNQLYGNARGILLNYGSNNVIGENFIAANQSYGLRLQNLSYDNQVYKNYFMGNSMGLQFIASSGLPAPGVNSVVYNTFNQNKNYDIKIDNGSNRSIQSNNFLGVDDFYKVANYTPSNIVAYVNYWDSFDKDSIHEMVYDYQDDSNSGLVYIEPFSEDPIGSIPVKSPVDVTKKLSDSGILVQWDIPSDQRISGFRIYYGKNEDWTFNNEILLELSDEFFLPFFDFHTEIAVTSITSEADNLNDIPEGEESWYQFARPLPYAGSNTTICYNENMSLKTSISLENDSIFWRSLGDGSFMDPQKLNTIYYPGVNDVANQVVELVLTQYSDMHIDHDTVLVNIEPEILIDAGLNSIAFRDSLFVFSEFNQFGADSVCWSSEGDGIFVFHSDTLSGYVPGLGDFESGMVQLFVEGYSECGNAQDSMLLKIKPSYILEGTVNAGVFPMHRGMILLYKKGDHKFSPAKMGTLNNSGGFRFVNVEEGDYLIYAISDKEIYPEFVPSYYVNDFMWDEAYKMNIHADTYDVDIHMKPVWKDFPKGVGQISGNFVINSEKSYEDQFFRKNWFGEETTSKDELIGFAAQNLTVILLSVDSIPIDWTLADEDGRFSFERLPYGNYYIIGEKAGYPLLSSSLVSVSSEHPLVSDIIISLNKNSISVQGPNEKINSGVSISPNPTSDILNVWCRNHNEKIRHIELVDVNSKLIFERKIDHDFYKISLPNIPSGIYFVKVTTNFEHHCIFKLLKR